MYEMYQNHTFLIFEFMYLCNPNIQKEEMYDSSYISYIGNFRESVNLELDRQDVHAQQDGEEDKVEVVEGATRFIARIISSHFPEAVDRANDSHFEAEINRL